MATLAVHSLQIIMAVYYIYFISSFLVSTLWVLYDSVVCVTAAIGERFGVANIIPTEK